MGRRADNKAFEMMTAAADKTAVNFEGGVKPPKKIVFTSKKIYTRKNKHKNNTN